VSTTVDWKVSLHGGHSGDYCDHAVGGLSEVLDAAIEAGFGTYGVSEHAPRLGDQYLYEAERSMGWTVEKIESDFARYCDDIQTLADEYAGRLTVLRGFEAEVVPSDRYIDIMLGYRDRYPFDYMVGSVHYFDPHSLDSDREQFEAAMEVCGGLEGLAVRYYELVTEMVRALKPEVVGHLDLVRKVGHHYGPLDTPTIREAAEATLHVVKEHNAILDLNTAGWRKGLDSPYPAPWLVQRADALGVPFCFGDDSHGPKDVGAGVENAREYLIENGVTTVTVLNRVNGEVVRRVVPLG
jgi:histidinol-phosphatase (PHP family)